MRFVLFIGLLMIAKAIRPEVTEGNWGLILIVAVMLYALWHDLHEMWHKK